MLMQWVRRWCAKPRQNPIFHQFWLYKIHIIVSEQLIQTAQSCVWHVAWISLALIGDLNFYNNYRFFERNPIQQTKIQAFQQQERMKKKARDEKILSIYSNILTHYFICRACRCLIFLKRDEGSHNISDEDPYQILLDLTQLQLEDVKLVIQNSFVTIVCSKSYNCSTKLGTIKNNKLHLSPQSVEKQTIHYQSIKQNVKKNGSCQKSTSEQHQQNGWKKEKQQIQQVFSDQLGSLHKLKVKISSYLLASFTIIDKKISKISDVSMTHIDKSSRQLQNFLKFYTKWNKSKPLLPTPAGQGPQ